MKLAEWRKRNGRTQEWVAAKIDVDQGFVSRIERAINAQVPRRDILERIYLLTDGAVEPNDFYPMPLWRRALEAARSALTRKAA